MRKTYWTPAAAMVLALAALGGCDDSDVDEPKDWTEVGVCTPAMEREGTCVRVEPEAEIDPADQP